MTLRPHVLTTTPRDALPADLDRLRAAWEAGIASADDGPLDMSAILEEVKREAREDRCP
jgi:hypothetical protein